MQTTTITIPIQLKTNLKNFEKTIQNAINGGGQNSFKLATFEVMEHVRDKVLEQYDKTKGSADKGKLRDTVSRIYMYTTSNSIMGFLGRTSELPFYWKFQEFGTKPSTRIQPFKVVPGLLIPIKKSNLPQTFNFSYETQMIEGFGLIRQIEIVNPGVQARNFISSGKLYINTYGTRIFSSRFKVLFNNLVQEHVSKHKL